MDISYLESIAFVLGGTSVGIGAVWIDFQLQYQDLFRSQTKAWGFTLRTLGTGTFTRLLKGRDLTAEDIDRALLCRPGLQDKVDDYFKPYAYNGLFR